MDKLIVVDISPVTSLDGGETQMFFSLMEHVTVEPNVSLSTARRQADFQLARGIKQKDVRAFILTNLIRQSDGQYVFFIITIK